MRVLFSYGLALLILFGAGIWLATGTLVTGGKGPGNGETPIIAVIEGEEHGPVATALDDAGILAEHHADPDAPDPTLTIAERNEALNGESAPLQTVRTVTSTAQPMPIEVPLRGRTRAKATITAVAETSSIVEDVHVSKGQRVEVGDLLCTLDQGTRAAAVAQAEAGLAQAQAGLEQAQLDFETNEQLRERGLAATNTQNQAQVALRAAQASLRAAEAALKNAQTELERTEIVAKVAGVIEDPLATEGSMLAQGNPCATIVELDPMVFAGSVPEAHIALAKEGLPATIRTVTGQTAEGEVTFVSTTADEDTRTFDIEIQIPNEDFSIRGGITAEATVNVGTAPGHLLPQSVLTLNDDGDLGLRAVDDEGVVGFYPVTIVSDTREGVWLTGLPTSLDVITVGQEFVTEGQTVATEETATAEAQESVHS
jgi:multidrug efflux system membrane fusion protein